MNSPQLQSALFSRAQTLGYAIDTQKAAQTTQLLQKNFSITGQVIEDASDSQMLCHGLDHRITAMRGARVAA
jgi:hypothetical protein